MSLTTNDSNNFKIHQLDFNNIKFTINKESKEHVILKNLSGCFKSGRLCALMGASGAGKSSLLNILSGFKTTNVTGNINVNGKKQNKNTFRKISSYIPQETILLRNMTVTETMLTSAELRLDPMQSHIKIIELINEILEILHLTKSAHTKVQKLSGGEAKRLAIGIELITNPPIMFCDEPTSGLDSVSSIQVITYLKKLAGTGRIVICSIHQPSTKLFEIFDDLYVLSDGQCIYNGPLDDLIPTFESAGFICPQYYNRADFVLDVASDHDHMDKLNRLITDNVNKHLEKEYICKYLDDQMDENINPDFIEASDKQMNKNPVKWEQQINCSVGFWTKFKILAKRQLTNSFRDRFYFRFRIIGNILIGILTGIMFYDMGNNAAKVISNAACIYFFMIFILFAVAAPTIIIVPLEAGVFLREYLNNWYSVKAYFLSKTVADIPILFICTTLFLSISYYATGQPMEIERFLKLHLILILVSLISQTIGLLFGSAFKVNQAIFFAALFIIPMAMFCGFFIKINEVSTILAPMLYISFLRHAFEGSIQSIYGNGRDEFDCYEFFCYFKKPQKFLTFLNMKNDLYYYNVLALVLWFLILQLLFYFTLKRKIKTVR